MEYLFHHFIPLPWLCADLLAVTLTAVVILFAIRRTLHPGMVVLEGLAFVFLYAGLFENFAVVQGWYVYGRSLLMFGDVPLSVPLIELDVLILGLWLLERMDVPVWCRPFVVGLFGMLQDLSLDPLSGRQVFAIDGAASGRWTWLLEPGAASFYGIPVYNYPGWMLIMLYSAVFLLIGREWFRRSGYPAWIGIAYPFAAMFLALLAMISPISQFLLWLAPFGSKGSGFEWILMAFHLLIPLLLLLFFWRGRMKGRFAWSADGALFIVPMAFHLSDIFWILAGGYFDILWLALLASGVHAAILAWIFISGRKLPAITESAYAP
jgi:hypothetical protein